MKNIILLISVMFCSIQCKSQSYLTFVPDGIDDKFTSKLIDSLQKTKNEIFVEYLTVIDSKTVLDSSTVQNNSFEATYILWEVKDSISALLITDNCVFINKKTVLDKYRIFDYQNFNLLWLRDDEDIYKVAPSIAAPIDKDIVFYLTPNFKRFFEFGRNAYYELNPFRNKYRQEYLSLLKSTVFQFNNEWEVFCSYQRQEM